MGSASPNSSAGNDGGVTPNTANAIVTYVDWFKQRRVHSEPAVSHQPSLSRTTLLELGL